MVRPSPGPAPRIDRAPPARPRTDWIKRNGRMLSTAGRWPSMAAKTRQTASGTFSLYSLNSSILALFGIVTVLGSDLASTNSYLSPGSLQLRSRPKKQIGARSRGRTTLERTGRGRVRYGGIRPSIASPRPPCDGTPSSSVWPSPRQTPGPS